MKWTNSWKHRLPKLTQEELENINRSVTSKQIKTVIKKLPPKQVIH